MKMKSLFLFSLIAASLCCIALPTGSAATPAMNLTPEETAFLREHPVWRVTGETAPPYQWIDKKHRFQGIAADYRAIIKRRLNVELQIVPAETWSASLDQLRRKECDITLLAAATPERDVYLVFTEPVLALPQTIITRSENQQIHSVGDLAGRRVVVPRSYAVHEYLARDHPEIVLLPRDDEIGAISAVALGDADAFVGDLFLATHAIERLGVHNLKVAGELPYNISFGIGVRKDWPAAVTILNKVIASITPEEHAAVRNKWMGVQGTGISLRQLLLSGGLMAVVAMIATLWIANRRLGRVVAEQKQTAAALRASEERWGFALEGAGDGVWDWDVPTNLTFFSRQWKAMLGYSDEELPNRFEEWEKLVHPDDLPQARKTMQRHFAGETPHYEIEHRMATRDGSYRWILARGRVVARDASGKPLRMVGTHTDVTERRRVEEELRRQEERLEEMIRARTGELQLAEQRLREMTNRLPGAVYQFVMKLDGSFAFTFCSEGFEEMTGARAEEAIRDVNTVWAGVHPDDLVELDRRARDSAVTMTRYVQDLRFSNAEGRRWWIRAESEPQRQPDGTILWNGNIMDITERKRLEEELAVAKAAAEAANLAKSTFLANMSHEIRTPMNAILGFSCLMLRENTVTGLQRQNLETIHRSGEHLLALINDILEMSKIEAGHGELRQSAFDIHGTLGELERMFRLRAEERGLSFAVERAGGVPRFVHGDEAKIRQVFINLIGNAVKFTDRGGVLARVMAGGMNDDSVRLRAEIIDTGPGIAADELPRLFQQFEQTAVGKRAGGTGLGLAISREFIRLMGGDIQVASELGRGTTFLFDFRVGLAGPGAIKPRADERRVIGLHGAGEPIRILIADDNPENTELLQQTLRVVGFETRIARDGEAAIAAFSAWRPRVVLMDLRMPGIDGLEAIRRIRQMQNGSAVAIIAVSASVFEDDRQQVFAAGGDDFLSKPLRESLLFAKLKHFTGVEYEYADEVKTPERSAPKLTAAELAAALPAEMRAALRQATLSADFDGMLAIVGQFAKEAPEIAAELRSRVESFDYQSILELLEPGGVAV